MTNDVFKTCRRRLAKLRRSFFGIFEIRVRLSLWNDPLARRVRASLAQLLVAAARHPVLARSVLELAKQLGMGIRTLEKLCKAEGITAKRCLDFIRCLRVVETPQRRWEPRVHVSQYYGDERTIRDLARQGGLDGPVQPGIAHYVDHQKFLESPRLREEIKRELRRT